MQPPAQRHKNQQYDYGRTHDDDVSVVVRCEQFYVDILRRRVSAQSDFYRLLATARDDLKESIEVKCEVKFGTAFGLDLAGLSCVPS